MIRNYFKIALRTMMRNKTYSLINILGLSLGVACCLLLALYIQDEYSYDRHQINADNLYRITTDFHSDKGLNKLATCSPPIAMAMRDELPEIEYAARLVNPPGVAQNLIKYEDNIFYETDGFIADSSIFDVLTYDLKEGNAKNALVHANSVVISESMAKKLFGENSALDKTIFISQGGPSGDFKITGVFHEKTKSHINANFFISMTSSGWAEYIRSAEAQGEWAGQNFIPSYVRLSANHNVNEVIKKMNEVLVKYGAEDMKALGMTKTLSLEPVKDIYLKSDIGRSPRITYIYVIASIAVFILIIACINFMNLSTAKATKRAGEIGVRKVMGAFRSSLIGQILGEAMVIVLISIVISVVMVQTALPFFNDLTGKSISFETENIGYFAAALICITIITGLVAGSYPAFYLSSFQPAQVLKGKIGLSNASGFLRQSLVVFQFMIGIALVCGMLIIGKQLSFVESKSLGFNSDAKIILPLRTESAQKAYSSLQKELSNSTHIKAVSATNYVPGSFIFNDFSVYPQGGNMDKAVLHRVNTVDYGYFELLGIKIISGRSFTENRELESNGKIILNRTAVKELGFTIDTIIGQELTTEWQGTKYPFQVIGVMEDYHQTTLKEKINPMLVRMAAPNRSFDFAIADISGNNFEEAIASIEKTWKDLITDTPLEYSFLDENFQKQYQDDRKISSIITSFTIIAMLISCMGLYGLSSYMAERRYKEIGIRKVMGANVNQIVVMMSKEFIKLVTIAFVIAAPLAWLAMNKWLEGFAYKITIEYTLFIWAGLGALFIALFTVSFESIRAALGNPVESLRNE